MKTFQLTAFVFIYLLICFDAQAKEVSGIDIVEYGIYELERQQSELQKGTSTGYGSVVTDLVRTEATETIPARLGVRFGFMFVVRGVPLNQQVGFTTKIHFPFPGITNPETGITKSVDEYKHGGLIGAPTFNGYGLTKSWEAIPGKWKFEMYYDGRKLAEKTFLLLPDDVN